jgi:hypothetical protein
MRLGHWTLVQMLVVLVMKMEMLMHDLFVQVEVAVPLGEEQYYRARSIGEIAKREDLTGRHVRT